MVSHSVSYCLTISPIVSVSHAVSYSPIGSIMSHSVSSKHYGWDCMRQHETCDIMRQHETLRDIVDPMGLNETASDTDTIGDIIRHYETL